MIGGETLSYVSSDCIFYLFLVRNLLMDFALFYLLFNRIRMLAELLFLVGVPPHIHQLKKLVVPQNEKNKPNSRITVKG